MNRQIAESKKAGSKKNIAATSDIVSSVAHQCNLKTIGAVTMNLLDGLKVRL